MTETITINDTEFDLNDFRSCASAVEEVSGQAIEKIPEEERQQYLDLLMQQASNDLSGADNLSAAQA